MQKQSGNKPGSYFTVIRRRHPRFGADASFAADRRQRPRPFAGRACQSYLHGVCCQIPQALQAILKLFLRFADLQGERRSSLPKNIL